VSPCLKNRDFVTSLYTDGYLYDVNKFLSWDDHGIGGGFILKEVRLVQRDERSNKDSLEIAWAILKEKR